MACGIFPDQGLSLYLCHKSVTVSTVSPLIYHEVMGPDAMIFVF